MKKRGKRKLVLLLLALLAAALLLLKIFVGSGSPGLSARLAFRLNWGISLPQGEEIYRYSEPFVSYYVLKYSGQGEEKLEKLLKEFETAEGKEIKGSFFLEDLETYHASLEEAYLPDFEEVDSFCTDAHGLSKLYLFYDSGERTLYLCELLD